MIHTAASTGRRLIFACTLTLTLTLALTLTLSAYATRAVAQDQPNETKPVEPQEYRTFYLLNTTQDAINDITTDLRNMLPRAKIYAVRTLGAITIRGTADDIQLAQRIIADIDRPAKSYRLTFTLKDSDAANSAGPRHIAMVIQVGGKSEVKQGSKVPIVTGSFNDETSRANTQVQYEDVGLMIESWLDSSGEGLRLHTKAELSSVSDEKSNAGIQDPVLHQSVFDGSSNLVEGKPLELGTLDSPGGSGKVEIEVVAEPVK